MSKCLRKKHLAGEVIGIGRRASSLKKAKRGYKNPNKTNALKKPFPKCVMVQDNGKII